MKIVVLAYRDIDVIDGISDLIHQYPDAEIILPMTGFHEVQKSVITAAEAHEVRTTLLVGSAKDMPPPPTADESPWLHTNAELPIAEPHNEAIRRIDHGDVVAFVWGWEDVDAVDKDRAYLEDFGVTQWDITDGASPMDGPLLGEGDEDELADDLGDAWENLVESLTMYIAWQVRHTMEKLMSQDPDA